MKLEMVSLVNREAQTSDTAVYRKDLPKRGVYSAIDIGFRVTNGATSAINMNPIQLVKRIALVVNGNENRIYLSGAEAFRLHWMKTGKPMPYTFTEAASGVQEVWFRMMFGRYLGDPLYALDLSRFENVQVQVDYDNTVWGAVAATTFTTGTATMSIKAHQFPLSRAPAVRGMIGAREFYSGTTVASGELVQKMPSSNPVIAASVYCHEDAIADATDITDIRIGKDNFAYTWLNDKWYNLQPLQNETLLVREQRVNLLLSNGATRDTQVNNIRFAVANARTFTLAAA